jgi:hypothetical protein
MALPLQAFAMPGGGFAAFLEGCAYLGFGGGLRIWDIFRRAKKPFAASEGKDNDFFLQPAKPWKQKLLLIWVICRCRGS